MILVPDNEYLVVLDACVLAPMPICDTLLRIAERSVYRPLWSEEILGEVRGVLAGKLGYTEEQARHRTDEMSRVFPEACVNLPAGCANAFECIPDPKDRHVLAAAVIGHAHGLVTFNVKDFPESCMAAYGIVRHNPDGFLINQYFINPLSVIEALNGQAAAIGETREQLMARLQKIVPDFAKLIKDQSPFY
jgi:predicted nucleic acid-binding protein